MFATEPGALFYTCSCCFVLLFVFGEGVGGGGGVGVALERGPFSLESWGPKPLENLAYSSW